MHAISKDRTVCSEDCVYIMIDSHVDMPGANQGIREAVAPADDDSDVESEADISEVLLIPENKALINVLYEKIMECQVRQFLGFQQFYNEKYCLSTHCA